MNQDQNQDEVDENGVIEPILELNDENEQSEESEQVVQSIEFENESYDELESEEDIDVNSNILLNSNTYSFNDSSTRILNRLLLSTFYDKSKYKNVLSEKGNNDLKKIIYINNLGVNTICPIYQVEFIEGMEVIQLPCNHCFCPEAITKWLTKEKAICPVCRLTLDSIEIEDKEETITTNVYNLPLSDPVWNTNTILNIPNLNTITDSISDQDTTSDQETISNLELQSTSNFLNNIMSQLIENQYEENIQRAILNSLDTEEITSYPPLSPSHLPPPEVPPSSPPLL
uniref:RING-type domain-containing protein n=1 Tax=viral metagenome TaxID=1070528 RepID=A0A6C0AZ73_9ZZZZ|tara:strand:- start:1741 stop:2598 length:858 start_codon:yes stop_codon:yes gene_type:complete